VANPSSNTCDADLQLLRNTVEFQHLMDTNHPHASKLHKIADTLLKIAEKHVERSAVRLAAPVSKENICVPKGNAPESAFSTNLSISGMDDISQAGSYYSLAAASDDSATNRTQLWTYANPTSTKNAVPIEATPAPNNQSYIPLTATVDDNSNCTDWTYQRERDDSLRDNGFAWQLNGLADLPLLDPNYMDYMIESNTPNRPLDVSFDWFSWDLQESSGGFEGVGNGF
jgi:hypothetical protein